MSDRLQKVISRAGLMSRRAAEQLIAQGRISIDGRTAVLGDRVDPATQRVLVDGSPIPVAPDLATFLVNKPIDVICTADDPHGRPTVVDMVDSELRLWPVGRLDADSEGLILVTNDGELTNRVSHPSFGVTKTYTVVVDGLPSKATVRRLVEGVELDDGPAAAVTARIVDRSNDVTMLELVMNEGRNREIRRMCDVIGHPVRRLVRTAIGPLKDRELSPGEVRRLGPTEVSELYRAAQDPDSGQPGSANRRDEAGRGDGATVPDVNLDAGTPEVYVADPMTGPLDAVVRPPGSKSATNRALIIASLARGGVSRLWNPLAADDTVVMRSCLRTLGVTIDDADDPWLVLGTGGEFTAPGGALDVGASGTTARFITAVAALVPGRVHVDGTDRMRERPIGDLTAALEQLGATVVTADGKPPVEITGGSLRGQAVDIRGSRSSQFVSALLMIAPMLEEPVDIRIVDGLVSRRYVDSTIEMMQAFGAQVERTDLGYSVAPTGYVKTHLDIEADASAAAYPLVAAAITGGSVTVSGLPETSTQPDLFLLSVLARMGCQVSHRGDQIRLDGPAGGLAAIDVDMSDAPDAALALAVACLFADAPSRIRGLSTLRVKETDRLAALRAEITRVGGGARIEGDDLVIDPGRLGPARIETYDDHRMAMSFALIGLVVAGIEILDPGCVAKTWPEYFGMLESLRG